MVVLPGAVNVGASLSSTVTVKLQVASGSIPFVAVSVTLVTPLANVAPLPVPLPLAVVAPVKA